MSISKCIVVEEDDANYMYIRTFHYALFKLTINDRQSGLMEPRDAMMFK